MPALAKGGHGCINEGGKDGMNMMLLGAYTVSVVLLLLTPGPNRGVRHRHGGSSWLSPGLDDPAWHQRGLPGARS